MDINQGVKLITKYIYDRKDVRVDINAVKIMMDRRQQEMLKSAVEVALEYYKGNKIVI